MTTTRLGIAAMAVFLGTAPALAGPCTADIDKAQAALDQRVDAIAGAGKAGTQSTAAQDHRQPTPGSIAKAEQKLGEGTGLEPAFAAMTLARQADAAGDRAACEGALADVKRIVGP